MTPSLREQVRQRAGDRCEYCRMPQSATELPHEADHIRSVKHTGPTELTNLCWACALCNDYKGSDVAAYVPGTDQLVRLFNPRSDVWDDHFWWEGPLLRGRTAIAEATIALLKINAHSRVDHRRLLIDEGAFPVRAGA
jgi:hypothetical protein